MSTADVALILIILIGAYSGYKQGFLLELFSFGAILLGILGGFKLMGYAIIFLDDEFNIDQSILPYLAFAVVFIAIVIIVRLLAKLMKASIDKTFLGQVDQAAGAGLGLFKTAFLISVSLWILSALNIHLPEKWTSDSWLLPKVESFAPHITAWISGYIPLFRDVIT